MTSPTGIRASIRSVEAAAIAGVVYAVLALVALGLLNRTPSLELDNAELTQHGSTRRTTGPDYCSR